MALKGLREIEPFFFQRTAYTDDKYIVLHSSTKHYMLTNAEYNTPHSFIISHALLTFPQTGWQC